jgi:hypothetical protein
VVGADGLTSEQRMELLREYGSLVVARDEAIRRSPKIAQIWQVRSNWHDAREFWEYFWKEALPVLGINVGPSRQAAEVEPVELPERRAPLPAGLGWFAWSKIQKAARAYAAGMGRNEVAKHVELPREDASRVRKMLAHELLRLNEAGKLVSDPRVASRGGRELALRYWGDEGWLDPAKSLD